MTYGPDVDYVLNGAFEMLDITPDLYVWVTRCPPALDYNTLMDDGGAIGRLERMFLEWWGHAPLTQRLAVLRAIHHGSRSMLSDQMRLAAEVVAGRSVDRAVSAILGIPETAFLQIPTVLMTNGRSRGFDHRKVRRLTKRERASIVPVPLCDVLGAWTTKTQAMFDRFSATLNEAVGYDLETLADHGDEEFRQGRHNLHILDELMDQQIQERLRAERQTHKIGRKVLKRSMRLMDRMIGDGSTEIFFSKQSLTFTGRKYQFEVVKKEDVDLVANAAQPHSFGSIPYVLTLRSLDGTYLAQGCLVFPGTPALDQVVALFLNIKAGNEDEIVSKTNWYNRSDAFRASAPQAVSMRCGARNHSSRHRWRSGRKPIAVRAGRKLMSMHRELVKDMIPVIIQTIRETVTVPVLTEQTYRFLAG